MRVVPLLLGVAMMIAGLAVMTAPNTAAQSGCTPVDSTLATYEDDFESTASGSLPTPCWATFSGTGSTFVTPAQFQSGAKSLQIGASGSATWTLTTIQCPASGDGFRGFAFDFRFSVVPAVDTIIADMFDTANGVGVNIESTGTIVQMQSEGSNAGSFSDDLSPGLSAVAGQWYRFDLGLTCDSTGSDSAALSVHDYTTATTHFVGRPHTMNGGVLNPTILAPASGAVFVDNVAISNVDVPPPTIATTATVAVAGTLSGFDVDPSGTTAIARFNDQTVRTYSGQTLVEANSVDTDCSMDSGVSAFADNVAYIVCNPSDPDDRDFIAIRNNILGPLTNIGPCDDDVSISPNFDLGTGDDDDDLREIKTFQLYSIDFDQADDPAGTNRCQGVASLGVSTIDGRVGIASEVLTVTGSGNLLVSDVLTDFAQFDPNEGPVDHICTVVPSGFSGATYMLVAGDTETTTKLYQVIPRGIEPEEEINQVGSLGGTFGSAKGIGCGRGTGNAHFILIGTASQVVAYQSETGGLPTAWDGPITVASMPSRGVTMSFDGEFGAYVDGSFAYILNLTDGEVTGRVALPSGTFKEIRMSTAAQSLWIATTTTIARYDIHTVTTVTPVGDETALPTDSFTNTATAGNNLGQGVLQVSSTTALFGSIAVIAGFAIVGYALTTRRGRRGDE